MNPDDWSVKLRDYDEVVLVTNRHTGKSYRITALEIAQMSIEDYAKLRPLLSQTAREGAARRYGPGTQVRVMDYLAKHEEYEQVMEYLARYHERYKA